MHYWVNQFAIPPSAPGGTRHFDFSKRLTEAGIPVTVVASDLNLATRQYMRRRRAWDVRAIREVIDGVPFHWLHTLSHETNDWRRSAGMVRFGQAAFHHLLRVPVERDTAFVGSSPTLFAALGAQKAAAIRGVRFVMEVRDLWPESMIEMTGHEGVTARALRVLADHLYRRADAIVVLARHNAEVIARRGVDPTKIHDVPNGVDLRAFGEASDLAVTLPRLSSSPSTPGPMALPTIWTSSSMRRRRSRNAGKTASTSCWWETGWRRRVSSSERRPCVSAT